MADQDPRPIEARPDNAEAGRPSRPAERERDFGDSAGYGSGGSTRDFRDVGDLDGDPVKGRRNPLDDVVKIKNPVQ